MRTKEEIIAGLTDPGVIAVVRVPRMELVRPLAAALLEGGLHAIEITLTTPNAVGAIREACQAFGARALIGVGTVIDAESCRAAIDAGANYVVTPVTRPALVKIAHAADRPIMLGAFTPTEAELAYEAGADFIKIFPAEVGGPAYIKALRAPLPHLRMVPTGGVNLETLEPFFEAGCPAVGVGSALLPKAFLRDQNWSAITRLAKDFVGRAQAVRRRLSSR